MRLTAAARATVCVPLAEAPRILLVRGAVRARDGAPGAPMEGFMASPRVNKLGGAEIGDRA